MQNSLIVDQTNLVLASGKLVLQKKLIFDWNPPFDRMENDRKLLFFAKIRLIGSETDKAGKKIFQLFAILSNCDDSLFEENLSQKKLSILILNVTEGLESAGIFFILTKKLVLFTFLQKLSSGYLQNL